jgi:hypothetical protein
MRSYGMKWCSMKDGTDVAICTERGSSRFCYRVPLDEIALSNTPGRGIFTAGECRLADPRQGLT